MRATWITSAVAGVIFGFLAARFGASDSPQGRVALIALFFVSALVCVMGLAQLREMRDQMGATHQSWIAYQKKYGASFLVPAWGRMAVWFVSAASGMILSKASE